MVVKYKLIIYVGVVVSTILLGFLLFSLISNHYYKKENKNLLKENIVRNTVNDILEKNASQDQQNQVATDKILQEQYEKVKEQNRQYAEIIDQMQKGIDEVNKKEALLKPEEKPVPYSVKTEQRKQLDRERSLVYINSIWEQYCHLEPGQVECRGGK